MELFIEYTTSKEAHNTTTPHTAARRTSYIAPKLLHLCRYSAQRFIQSCNSSEGPGAKSAQSLADARNGPEWKQTVSGPH